jgi:hypothetical protein
MNSKHVESILEIFRDNYRNINCKNGNQKVKILVSNLWPDFPTTKVFVLSSNKSITAEELEFADAEGSSSVVLGSYTFTF